MPLRKMSLFTQKIWLRLRKKVRKKITKTQ
jgi:hypothetical protein